MSNFIIEGNLENNTTFNGKNETISNIIIRSNSNSPLVPQNITIKNYIVNGNIVLGDNDDNALAPTNITFENLVIVANKQAPVFIGSNCKYITFKNCIIEGVSNFFGVIVTSSASHITFDSNLFKIKTKKQIINLNEANNIIVQNNNFINPTKGGIKVSQKTNIAIANNAVKYRYNNFISKWFRSKFFPFLVILK